MNATAAFNTLYGERAGQYLTSGAGNTCIGATNCNNNTTGNSNICLGYGAMAGEASGSLSNNIVIGNGIQSGASNRIILGDGTQTSMDLKVVSGSTVNMGGILNMNDAIVSNRRVSAAVFSIQDYTNGVISGEITHKAGGVDIVSAGNGGTIKALCKDGVGTQLTPLSISTSSILMNSNLFMNNTLAIANRQIFSSYYNFYATDNVSTLTYSGRLYGNLNSIVYDCPDTNAVGSSSHIFYNYNGATALNTLTISNTGITSGTPQPAASNSSTIVPTTAWVQSAIALAVPSTPTTTVQLVQVGGYNAATGLAFPSPVTVTVPANAQYADIFLAGEGGAAGQGGDRAAGGYYTGGAGGGACAASGRIFCKGLSITISKSLGVITLTVGGIGIIDVASGSNGGGASPSGGGPGGIATTTAPSIYQPGYSSWFTYTGTAGGNGQANNPPTVGAIKYTGYNASALLGCGQQISTSGGANPYAFQTTYFGGAIITFYST
jgi:hypothetical protein